MGNDPASYGRRQNVGNYASLSDLSGARSDPEGNHRITETRNRTNAEAFKMYAGLTAAD